MLTGLPFAAVNVTLTLQAFAWDAAVPASAVKAYAVVLQVPTTTLELCDAIVCPFTVFWFAQAFARVCACVELTASPLPPASAAASAIVLRFCPDYAEIAEVHGKCDHAHHENHQDRCEDGDGPAAGVSAPTLLKHGKYPPFDSCVMTTVDEIELPLNHTRKPLQVTFDQGTLTATVISVPVPGAGLELRLGETEYV